MAHKHLTLSASFISNFLSEQLIFSVLSSHVSRLNILPNFSPVFEVSIFVSFPVPLNLLARPGPVLINDSSC